jgi:coatomer subunit epsilon
VTIKIITRVQEVSDLSNSSFIKQTELVNIHSAFHQGQYQNVIEFQTTSLSADNQLPARILQLRAKIALGRTEEVLADVEGEEDTPDLAAVKALAQLAAGDIEDALKTAQELATKESENATVQVLCGTVLHAEGKADEALALLSKHQGNLEA